MSFSGDLKQLPLADVVQSIHQNTLSGALAVRDPRGERLIAFEAGFVTGCTGASGAEQALATELVRRGVVSQEQARPSRLFKRRGGLRRTLKRKKILDSGEFVALTREVILERIYDCFLLEEGTYEFLDAVDPARFDEDERSAEVRINPNEILMEAMRRVDEWQRIRRAIRSFEEVYVATRPASAEDGELEQAILEQTGDGRRALNAVLEALPAARFAACEAVLALVHGGALRVATGPEYLELGKAAEGRGELDAAAELYAAGLHYERGNGELHERRVGALRRLGRGQEAADESKLFAGSLLEQGDRAGARAHFSLAAKLSPADPVPLERLLAMELEDREDEAARGTAKLLSALYLRLGLSEKARGVYPRLLERRPRDIPLRRAQAEVLAESGDEAAGAQLLHSLATEALQAKRNEQAGEFLRRAVELAPEDERLKTLLQDVETGAYQRRRRRRRILIAVSLGAVLLCAGLGWGAYEAMALAALREATREGVPQLDRGCPGILAGSSALEHTAAAYPGTRAAAWADELIAAYVELYVREARGAFFAALASPSPAEPLDPKQVQQRLAEAVQPPGGPELGAEVARAEEALAAGAQELARGILQGLAPRVAQARLAMVQAGPSTRRTRAFTEASDPLRELLPRFHLAWARVSLAQPSAGEALAAAAASLVSEPEPPPANEEEE